MSAYRNTEAIVIKMYNAGDADRVVHLITTDGSRLVAMAKGIKKTSSRKSHAIDLLNHLSAKLVKGKGELEIITEAKLLNSTSQFKSDYTGLMFAQAVCEVIDVFVQPDNPEAGYYRNLENLLTVATPSRLALLLAALILRLLQLSGDLPRLNEDISSGEDIAEGTPRYTTEMIGYTAEQALAVNGPIPDRIYKTQRFMLSHDFATIQQVNLSSEEQIQLLQIHINWLQILTNKQKTACQMFLSAVANS